MNLYIADWGYPPLSLVILMFAAPGMTGMAVAGTCGWFLRSRQACNAMLGWGLLVNATSYVAFIPTMIQLLERMDLFGYNAPEVVVFIGYFCLWYLVILGIAVVYRLRRDVRPNWKVNRWGNSW